jgi:uncharacterized protein (TIGR02246 family)
MRSCCWLLLALNLAAVLAAGSFVTASRALANEEDQKAEEKEPPGKERRDAFVAAFNKGDAKAIAAFWAPDATYVDHVGREHKGREAIEELYKKVFAAHKGLKLTIHLTSSKLVSPDVWLEEGISEVTEPDGGLPTVGRFMAVLVKKDGQWYLERLHDAVAHPPSHAEHLEHLHWLIGAWTGEAEKGESRAATYDWAANQNFIVCSFTTTLNGAAIVGGTQFIGWDAVDKQVRSWSFYSQGGFSEGTWTNEGNRWLSKTTARTADGKKVSATIVVTKTDDDHMTWQMTKVIADGESLPDHELVKMKRVKPAQQ